MRKEIVRSQETELGVAYEARKDSFLATRNWIKSRCRVCEKTFFSKQSCQFCGNVACQGGFNFLYDERKRKNISPIEINVRFESFFEEKGLKKQPAKSILNQGGTTLFTSAGVQILDDAIFRGAQSKDSRLFVSQPSLRTQYLESIGEGYSLSFVNICTEQLNASSEDHFTNLDQWIEFLSNMGLYMGDVTLQEREKKQQWGDLTLYSKVLALYYKGLEIGDGNYNYGFNPTIPGIISISDFGFGLERLDWILRKGSYFDTVGPLTESLSGKGLVQELSKTLTLLASSGLQPSNKERGYRYRLFAKKIVEQTFPEYLDLSRIVKHQYQYWQNFVEMNTGIHTCQEGVQREYDRNFNQSISEKLLINDDTNCSTQDFLIKLLQKGIKREELSQILSRIKD